MRAPDPARVAVDVVLGLALLAAVGLLWARARQVAPPPAPVVELCGELPNPGFYAVSGGLPAAIAAAGGDARGWPGIALPAGARVEIAGDQAKISLSDERLTLGLPIDLNSASAAALESVPGIGSKRAEAIIADRAAHGAFGDVAALDRVKGIGPSTVAALAPYLDVQPATAWPTVTRATSPSR